jgi:hypothetical protein
LNDFEDVLKQARKNSRNSMKKNQKSVSDLGAAAYMLMHDWKVMGRRGKDIFFLLDEEKTSEKFDQLTLDYLSSEFHRFDACIMSIKKIGEYSFENRTSRSVTDLGAAAYILMHKYRIVGRRGKSIFFEVDDENKFDEIALEYISSDYHRFDSCLMSLKKIGEYVSGQ